MTESPAMSAEPLDLDTIRPWTNPCGSCDVGLPQSCTCPSGDPRGVILRLIAEVENLRRDLEQVGGQLRASSRNEVHYAEEAQRMSGIVRDLLDAWEVGSVPADVVERARALYARGGAA